MKDFPCLKKPSGYTLLLKDFCYIYPQNKESLFENFPIYKSKILQLAKTASTTLRDTTLKDIIKESLDLAPDSEETSSLAALLVLPFLFSPVSSKRKKGNTVCWRPSKIEMRDGFILHIRSQVELQEAITRRKEKYVKLGLTLQPMVIVVGPKISEINQYSVTVDDTFYELHSIVSAVDCCFKVIHALNAEYPTECLPIWTFIQKDFYKIKTTYDTEYVTVNSLISDLGIQE
ncbi:uncharacterized protein LOC132953264 [Metopolophium dirhodum]|uniref:uncharacterized protein LOC132953264 n=1 Tax=Metopolophium dirhodum TaxID=44670 RepID=UPI00299019A0|nr:uncharacterized protein LOC132953264 [Metopolophium dirhodum]